MKILISGASGLVGSELVQDLTGRGHYVVRLVRGAPDASRGDIAWDPVSGRIERAKLEGIDAVIHLSGENIMGLWTAEKKRRLVVSRVQSTEFLCECLASMPRHPKVLLSASGVGYYGSRGEEWLDERTRAGSGFLAELCVDWERATNIASSAGIRVANLRFGLILSRRGGLLARMLTPFRLALGGRLGSGRQYMSWIGMPDVMGAIAHLLESERVRGPVNLVAPEPVTNADFTWALAQAVHRPAIAPVPAFLLNRLPGEFARETMLASQRAEPRVLRESGYTFALPSLPDALTQLIGSRA